MLVNTDIKQSVLIGSIVPFDKKLNKSRSEEQNSPRDPLKTVGNLSSLLSLSTVGLFLSGLAQRSPTLWTGALFGLNYGGGISGVIGGIKIHKALRENALPKQEKTKLLIDGALDIASGIFTCVSAVSPAAGGLGFLFAKLLQVINQKNSTLKNKLETSGSKSFLEKIFEGYGKGTASEWERSQRRIKNEGIPSSLEIFEETVKEVKETPGAGSAFLGTTMANVGIKSLVSPLLPVTGAITGILPVILGITLLGLYLGSRNASPERDELGAKILAGIVLANHAPVKWLAEHIGDPKGNGLLSKLSRAMVSAVDAVFKGTLTGIAKEAASFSQSKAKLSKETPEMSQVKTSTAGTLAGGGTAAILPALNNSKSLLPPNPGIVPLEFALFDVGWIFAAPLIGEYLSKKTDKKAVLELAKKLGTVTGSNLAVMGASAVLAKAILSYSLPLALLVPLGALIAVKGYRDIWGNKPEKSS